MTRPQSDAATNFESIVSLLGEELIDLLEQRQHWWRLSAQMRDQRALDALAAMPAGIEGRMARVKGEMFHEGC
jgi:hypothetical protein